MLDILWLGVASKAATTSKNAFAQQRYFKVSSGANTVCLRIYNK